MHNVDLIKAYQNAKYIVNVHNINHRIRVGVNDLMIEKMLIEKNAQFAYFITPENPFSQNLTNEENELRHGRFNLVLNQKNLPYLEGYGTDEDEQWPRERSYLIFCNDESYMHELAVNFGQLGILKIERDKPVTLLILGEIKYFPVMK